MKTALQIVVLGVIVALAWMLVDSINQPIQFQNEMAKRKTAVVERLKLIRDAQVAYKAQHEKYTAGFDTLIAFVKTGNYKLLKKEGELTDSMLNAGMTEKEALKKGIIKRDTMYVSIADSLLKGLPADSLEYVPYTNGAKFEMGAAMYQGSNMVIPIFECKVENRVYLQGLDNQERINLDDEARQLNRYPGLKVGSLEEANNNAGNWE